MESTYPADLALLVPLVNDEPFTDFQVTRCCCNGERSDAPRVWVANVVSRDFAEAAFEMVDGRLGGSESCSEPLRWCHCQLAHACELKLKMTAKVNRSRAKGTRREACAYKATALRFRLYNYVEELQYRVSCISLTRTTSIGLGFGGL